VTFGAAESWRICVRDHENAQHGTCHFALEQITRTPGNGWFIGTVRAGHRARSSRGRARAEKHMKSQ
jgi:hypothetical protein